MKIVVGKTYKDKNGKEYYVDANMTKTPFPGFNFLVWGGNYHIYYNEAGQPAGGEIEGRARNLLPNKIVKYSVLREDTSGEYLSGMIFTTRGSAEKYMACKPRVGSTERIVEIVEEE